MRQLESPLGGAPLSAVGFGCASLGSRIGAAEGQRALARAFEAGITWFDVAPSYGDGNAERILGEFAAPRRGALRLCTKVGLLARPPGWKAALRPLARGLVARVPALRRLATGARSVARLPLTAAGITASAEESLRRLRTERIDLLMLHDPVAEDVAREDVARALDNLVQAGKVGAVGVAGSPEAAERGAGRHPFRVLQVANNPLEHNSGRPALRAWQEGGGLLVTHSALGAYGALPALSRLLAVNLGAKARLRDAGYEGEPQAAAADFLTDYALATNGRGVCLFSAMKPAHLAALLRRVDHPRDAATMAALGASLTVLIEGSRQ